MQPWQPQQPQQPPPPQHWPQVPGALPPRTSDEVDLAALTPFWPKVAAALVALAGVCGFLGSLQTWMTVDIMTEMAAFPVVDALLGVACIALATRLLSARRWAAVAALVTAALLTLTSGVWCVYAVANRFIAVFVLLAPIMSLAATALAAISLGPCDRAEQARARLAAQGLELGI
jgi:hypothetical protein